MNGSGGGGDGNDNGATSIFVTFILNVLNVRYGRKQLYVKYEIIITGSYDFVRSILMPCSPIYLIIMHNVLKRIIICKAIDFQKDQL